MKLLIRMATPVIYFVVLFISMNLSIFLIGPSVAIWGGYSLFGNGDVTLAVNGLIVGFTLFAVISRLVKFSWIEYDRTIRGHFLRCFPLYFIGIITAIAILKFTFPTYRNPGIGGAWAVAACFSCVAGIIADKMVFRVAEAQRHEST